MVKDPAPGDPPAPDDAFDAEAELSTSVASEGLQSDDAIRTSILPVIDDAYEARELVVAAQRELETEELDDEERARLHHALAVVFEERLDDLQSALFHFQRAYELCPENTAYIGDARRVFWARQNWTLVLELLDAELARVSDPARAARLSWEKGLVNEDWLANSSAARTAYEEALRRDPTDRRALHRLRRLLAREGDHERLLEVCRRAITATDDRRLRCVLYGEVGRVQLEQLDQPEQAMESYSVAFVEDPANGAVREALKQLYLQHRRWGDLIDVLLTEGDFAGSQRERDNSYLAAARICRDRLDQPDRALELLSRIEQESADLPVLREMAELLRRSGRHERLAEVYEQLLGRAPQLAAGEAGRLQLELARLLSEKLKRPEQALRHYELALAEDPGATAAGRTLERQYAEHRRWGDLLQLQRQQLSLLEDGPAQAALLARMALLLERRLDEPLQAIEAHRQALNSDPEFEPSMRALDRLYRQTGSCEQLLELQEQQLTRLTPPRAALALERLGALCEHQLDDSRRAVEYYRRALASEQHPDPEAVSAALHRLLWAAGDDAELLRQLDEELTACGDDRERRRTLLREAAGLLELVGDLAGAAGRQQQLLELDPADQAALRSLGRLREQCGDWHQVVRLHQLAADSGAEPPAVAHLRNGEIFGELLGEEEQALGCFQRALAAEPRLSPALAAQARIHRAREDWEQLCATHEQQIALIEQATDKAAKLFELAEVKRTKLEQLTEAVALYREVLELVPGHGGARDTLVRLLVAEGRYDEAVDVLETSLAHDFDEGVQLSLYKRLGRLWGELLGEPDAAIACYKQALALAERDTEALQALARLSRETGEFELLVSTLQLLAESSDDAAERVRLLDEAARAIEVHLVPDVDPRPVYRQILEHAPGDGAALAALARLQSGRGAHAELADVCERLLAGERDRGRRKQTLLRLAAARETTGDLVGAEAALAEAAAVERDWVVLRELRRLRELLGRWDEVAELLEREAEAAHEPSHASASLMSAAQLYQDRFDDAERAIRALQRVLARQPFHEEAARRLEQLLVQREDWEQLVAVTRRRLEAAAAGARPDSGSTIQAQIELLVRVAWIQREHLQQPAEAVGTLERAIELDPHHVPTLLTLAELNLALGQWNESVDVHSRIVALSDEPELLRRLHFQLGEVFFEHLDDPRRAVSSFQNVLAIAPRDRRALRRLYSLFRGNGDWDNAADALNRLLEIERDPQLQVEHRLDLADICEQGFGEPELAAEHLEQALAIRPADEQVLARLTALYRRLGQWGRLCEAIRTHLASLPEEQQVRGIGRRMELGDVLQQQLGRPVEALEQYRAVVEIDPTDIDARLASARLLVEQHRPDEAVSQHREVLEIDPLRRESLRQLRAIWTREGRPQLACAAAAVLVCCEMADEDDRRVYRAARAARTTTPQTALDSSAYAATLLHPGEHQTGRAVLAVLSDVAHRIRPPQLDQWQVSKADRLPARSEDPLRGILQQVRVCLGLARDVEIYISPTQTGEIDLLMTDPPALVVGASVMGELSTQQIRFWAAELLSYVRNRDWIAYGLGSRELGTLVQACCRLVEPSFSVTGVDEAHAMETTRLIQRSLNRRGRRSLEDAVRAMLAKRAPVFPEWALSMRLTALRTALWVVDDLETALLHLRQREGVLGDAAGRSMEELVRAMRQHRLAAELIRFWLSEDFTAAKQAAQTS